MKKLFSLLALVGVIAACQPEKLDTAFEVADAVATITVNAVDVNTQAPAEGVTITASDAAAAVSGNVVTIKGTPAISAKTVTVTANYKGADYSQNVSINALLAGGSAAYSVVIPVGVPVGEQTFEYKLVEEKDAVASDKVYFTLANGHDLVSHSHNGTDFWAENLSDFILEGEVTWTEIKGYEYVGYEVKDEVYAEIVKLYAETMEANAAVEENDAVLEFQVSAWAYYTVYAQKFVAEQVYGVYADGVLVGTVDMKAISSQAEYEEIANPMGHGHYHYGHGQMDHGHGHGHGHGSGNAGGGIVWGE